jgi:hypothetical protein
MINGNDEEIIIKKITESTDHSELYRVLGQIVQKLVDRPDREQFICSLMESLSAHEAELIRFALETSRFVAHESFPFFERRKEEYEKSLRWKRVFGFMSPAKLTSKASNLAFGDMKKMGDYFSRFQGAIVKNVIEMRKNLTISYRENIRKLIDSENGRLLDIPSKDVVMLQEKCENLLNNMEEFEKRQ